jgi:hypothetical protein
VRGGGSEFEPLVLPFFEDICFYHLVLGWAGRDPHGSFGLDGTHMTCGQGRTHTSDRGDLLLWNPHVRWLGRLCRIQTTYLKLKVTSKN